MISWYYLDVFEVYTAIQEMSFSGPNNLGVRAGIGQKRFSVGGALEQVISMDFIYFGSESELRELLSPALGAGSINSETIAFGSLRAAIEFTADASSPNAYLAKSNYAELPFTDDAISTMLDFIDRMPSSAREFAISMHSVGGEANTPSRTETAYVHRDSRMLFEYEVGWFSSSTESEINENKAWIQEFSQAMQPSFNGESYQNFIDPSLENWEQAYYAENFARLVTIKSRYDPDNVFNFRQSIPVT